MLALATAFVAAVGGLRGIADLLLRGKGAADDYAALAEHAATGTAPRSMAPVPARLTQGVTLRGAPSPIRGRSGRGARTSTSIDPVRSARRPLP